MQYTSRNFQPHHCSPNVDETDTVVEDRAVLALVVRHALAVVVIGTGVDLVLVVRDLVGIDLVGGALVGVDRVALVWVLGLREDVADEVVDGRRRGNGTGGLAEHTGYQVVKTASSFGVNFKCLK